MSYPPLAPAAGRRHPLGRGIRPLLRVKKKRPCLAAGPLDTRIKGSLVLILDVLIHRGSGSLACAHGEDNGSRAGNGVAAGEYAVLGGDAVLVISHDRYFLDRVTNRTLEIAGGRLYASNGNYSAHKALREKDKEVAQKHYVTASREIKRMEESIARFRQFNREKSIRAAESKQKALDKFKEQVEAPEEEADTIRFDFTAAQTSGNEVIVTDELSMGFGERELFRDVKFQINRKERVFLLGPNGCGKTTLLRDMIRKISDEGQTVGVVDERSEIGACYQGVAQNDLGIQTDVMDACEKGQGMNMLIRSMAPDVIAVDEIGSKEDVEALFFCAYRGCSILATAHGKNKESLSKNPYMREIINKKMFQRYVILEQRNQPGYIAQIMDENGVVLN